MKCNNLTNEYCSIINTYILDNPHNPDVCTACSKCNRPQQLNQVLVDYISFQRKGADKEMLFKFWLNEMKTNNIPLDQFPTLFERAKVLYGPGTYLNSLIKWFYVSNAECNCDERIMQMNQWGPLGCCKNYSTIHSWLEQSALVHNVSTTKRTVFNAILISVLRSNYRLKTVCSKTTNANTGTIFCIVAELCKEYQKTMQSLS